MRIAETDGTTAVAPRPGDVLESSTGGRYRKVARVFPELGRSVLG